MPAAPTFSFANPAPGQWGMNTPRTQQPQAASAGTKLGVNYAPWAGQPGPGSAPSTPSTPQTPSSVSGINSAAGGASDPNWSNGIYTDPGRAASDAQAKDFMSMQGQESAAIAAQQAALGTPGFGGSGAPPSVSAAANTTTPPTPPPASVPSPTFQLQPSPAQPTPQPDTNSIASVNAVLRSLGQAHPPQNSRVFQSRIY